MIILSDIKVNIIKTKGSGTRAQLILPVNVCHALAIKSYATIKLSIGSYQQSYSVFCDDHLPSNTIRIASAKVGFLPEKQYSLHWDKNKNTLYIGPLIAILTSKSRSGKRLPFAGRPKFLKEIVEYGNQGGALVYCVTPEGIFFDQRQSRGYSYIPKSKWITMHLPLPDVVYNRVPSRSLERKQNFIITRKNFTKKNIPFFNPHFLNKGTIEQMMRTSSLSKFVPYTEKLTDIQQLSKFINRFSSVYLKPIHSFAGKGIMRIMQSDRVYIVQCRNDYHNKPHYFQDLGEVYAFVSNRIAKPYLIQQGISLAKYQKCSFDVRALIQRNGVGRWEMIGMGCRVAGPGQITTHVPNGGRIAPVDAVLQSTFKQKASEIKRKITELVVRVPPVLEHYYGYEFGIISMDIGIDKQGRLWFFEANSKPMEFDEIDTQQRSLKDLIAYSRHLAWNKKEDIG